MRQEKKDDDYVSKVKDGVEVIDVKITERDRPRLDQFGMPVPKGESISWDKKMK